MIESSIDEATMRRIARGRALVANVEEHGDLYTVKASDRDFWYTVSLDNVNGECCECEDWRQHGFGHICKHIYAVVMFESRCRRTGRRKVIRH